jgi:hypothetical protein
MSTRNEGKAAFFLVTLVFFGYSRVILAGFPVYLALVPPKVPPQVGCNAGLALIWKGGNMSITVADTWRDA